YKANKGQEAIAALSESVKAYGSLPEGKRALWRLATVKETEGELKEALDLYFAGYEAPAPGSEIDVNRAVIEAVYRKVNGSLDGLNKRLGVSDTSSSTAAADLALAKNNSPGAKPDPSDAKAEAPAKQNARNPSGKSDPKARTSAGGKGTQIKRATQ